MAGRMQQMMQSASPEERAKAQEVLKGSQLTDFFKDLDLGEFGKKFALIGIDWVQANLLPKLQSANAMAAIVVAGLLDALEAQLKK